MCVPNSFENNINHQFNGANNESKIQISALEVITKGILLYLFLFCRTYYYI